MKFAFALSPFWCWWLSICLIPWFLPVRVLVVSEQISEAEIRKQGPKYVIVSDKVKWEQAAAQCQQMTNGEGDGKGKDQASLVTIETSEEDNRIRQLINSAANSNTIGEHLWTAGQRDDHGDWSWSSSGEKFNYTRLPTVQTPSAGAGRQNQSPIRPAYLTVISSTLADYEWFSEEDLLEKYGYICEIKPLNHNAAV